VDDVGRPALAGDDSATSGEVEIVQVEHQHFLAAGGRLVEHAPQAPVADAGVPAGEQALELRAGEGPTVVLGHPLTLQGNGGVIVEPALPLGEAGEAALTRMAQ